MAMIACCGVNCSKCEAYQATMEDSDEKRTLVARKWTELYKTDIQSHQINCNGCRSEGVHFFFCDTMCEIRKCVLSRKIENCAVCEDYQCEALAAFIEMAPEVGEALEALRTSK